MPEMIPDRIGLFQAASANLALPADKLVKVLEQPKLFTAPGLPVSVRGLLLFQKQVVPVLHYEDPAGSSDLDPSYVVLCGSSLGLVGFACDAVRQIAAVVDGRIEVIGNGSAAGAVGRFYFQSETYTVIDVDLLVECLPE